jgi:hypothetical protein
MVTGMRAARQIIRRRRDVTPGNPTLSVRCESNRRRAGRSHADVQVIDGRGRFAAMVRDHRQSADDGGVQNE